MTAIPHSPEPKEFRTIKKQDSPFVEIRDNAFFSVSMQYPLLNMKNAESRCFVRSEVYDRLLTAQSYLPDGYKLMIWDAWRPLQLQKELYALYSQKIIAHYAFADRSAEEQECLIQKYVSLPTADRNFPPVHTTGGAVDLTIIDANGCELDMGSRFDEFGDITHTDFFENTDDQPVKENRRLLYWSMTKAGFTNLPSEWWHYDYGDRFWGYYNSKPAIYTGCFSKEDLTFEKQVSES